MPAINIRASSINRVIAGNVYEHMWWTMEWEGWEWTPTFWSSHVAKD